jgi:uncharacterized protein
MSEILTTIRKDMFTATKDKDEMRKGIAQILMASVKNKELETGKELKDEQVIEILRKEAKKLLDSFQQFTDAGREDLATSTKSQLDYVETFLPQLMSLEEVKVVVAKKIEALGATSVREMGKVMGATMGELKGKADGAVVKTAVEELLK